MKLHGVQVTVHLTFTGADLEHLEQALDDLMAKVEAEGVEPDFNAELASGKAELSVYIVAREGATFPDLVTRGFEILIRALAAAGFEETVEEHDFHVHADRQPVSA